MRHYWENREPLGGGIQTYKAYSSRSIFIWLHKYLISYTLRGQFIPACTGHWTAKYTWNLHPLFQYSLLMFLLDHWYCRWKVGHLKCIESYCSKPFSFTLAIHVLFCKWLVLKIWPFFCSSFNHTALYTQYGASWRSGIKVLYMSSMY